MGCRSQNCIEWSEVLYLTIQSPVFWNFKIFKCLIFTLSFHLFLSTLGKNPLPYISDQVFGAPLLGFSFLFQQIMVFCLSVSFSCYFSFLQPRPLFFHANISFPCSLLIFFHFSAFLIYLSLYLLA